MGGRVVSDEEEEIEEEEDAPVVDRGSVGDRGRGNNDDDDEEEEEEEGQDEYEKDDFIVDDVDEEEEQDEEEDGDRLNSDEEERHKKKKRKKRESERNYVLDEDDYELLQDNNITGFRRPKPGSKKFKRLKKAGRDSEGEQRSGFFDEEESDINGRGGRTAEEKLKRSLFGDDEAPLEDIAEEEEQVEEEEDVDIGEEDEMADFIVDEEDVDENGIVVRKKKTNKKKSRQAPGVSSSALQEAHEIFGDVDELLTLRKQGLARGGSDSAGWGEKRLEDEFEPLIIEEKYMTQKDDLIRDTDIPERIQLSEAITGSPPTDDKSIEEESAWIYDQLVSGGISPLVGDDQFITKIDKEEIGNVLTMIHVQKLDIPFIAMYRKELCLSLLEDPEQKTTENQGTNDDVGPTPKLRWHKVLWAIQTLDKKWLLLQKRKNALLSYYSRRYEEEARRIYDETRLALNQQLFKSVTKALKDAKSEREVDDVDAKFNLHFPPGEVDMDEGQFKRPKRKSLYSICNKAGLWEVANKFGPSSEKFGLLLTLEEMKSDELEDAKETPEEVATNFMCAMFEAPKDVLKGARHMAAVEISSEPIVRKHVRNFFMDNAVVSTSPTLEGNTTIDVYHQYASVKWLRNKPVSKFWDGQWLLIQKAEEEKLLQVSIRLPEEKLKTFLKDIKELYLSDCVSKTAQLWDEQRGLIIDDSFNNFILPLMEKEARSVLTARAKNWLLVEYGKQLWSKVYVAPYNQHRKDSEGGGTEDEAVPKVLACCWGPGKPATTIVMLDSAGEVLDVLYVGSICSKSKSVNEVQRKKNDQERIFKFMMDHQQDIVCVGAANYDCKALKEEINEIVFRILENHARDVATDFGSTQPFFGDESLPRLYENSRISSDQLPGQPGIVKRAVALGRYLQNPLAMVATLCGPGREILSWKLCPMEDFLSPDEKYGVVEQVMIDATNQVGIDINMAASHEWHFAPLQFISGLGPRKASALQKALARAGSVFSRKEITMGILRKKVFINSVGFLRIRRSGAATASTHVIDLLDDTRIHPESYDLAKTLAKDVYEEAAQQDPNDMDDDVLELAIDYVRENPRTLKSLNIDEYAKSVEHQLGTRKKQTLYDIKMELLHGFQDWRTPFSEPTADEEFCLITGETDDTLSEGRIVQVAVRFVQEHRVVCTFDCGLKGVVPIEDFSDDPDLNADTLQEKLRQGDILTCKIKNVVKHRSMVYLTCKGSDLNRRPQNFRNADPYYMEDEINVQSEKDKARKKDELAKKHFKHRMIVHPRFQNVAEDEAIKFLSDKEPGESIIRPSKKGPSYLTLTLKVYDGIYAHKDIVEGDKDHKDITSLLRLGKKLTIGDDTFEDLDEVIDRYVDPLVAHLKNMLGYRKFRSGDKKEVDELLMAEKAENPSRIVYCFGISRDYPGTFILSYIRSSNPHHEYVSLYPKGFKFRKREFDDIDRLVAYFQRHINSPPAPGPSIKSVAAVVPMRSPATGGGSLGSAWVGDGAYNSDSWRGQTSLDRERSSTPNSRMGDRFDQRNSTGRDGHPSGLPRPYGRGRGRGRGNSGSDDGQDSGFVSSKWGAGSKEDNDGLSSFPGAKVQDSPGRERFPGGWGGGDDSIAGGGAWGGGGAGRGRGGSGSWGGGGDKVGGESWGRDGNGDGGSWGGGSDGGRGHGGRNSGGRGDRDGGGSRSGVTAGYSGGDSNVLSGGMGCGGWGGAGSSGGGGGSWGGAGSSGTGSSSMPGSSAGGSGGAAAGWGGGTGAWDSTGSGVPNAAGNGVGSVGGWGGSGKSGGDGWGGRGRGEAANGWA